MLASSVYEICSQLLWPSSPAGEGWVSNSEQNWENTAYIPEWDG